MRPMDYIAAVLTTFFVVSFVGCVVHIGSIACFGTFWFYAGVLVLSGSILFYMSSQ